MQADCLIAKRMNLSKRQAFGTPFWEKGGVSAHLPHSL